MTAGRLILRGAAASAGGLPVRLAGRILFLIVAGQLYGAALFGAYSLAVAVVELAVAIGGLGMKRLIFQHLDERGARPELHVLADSAALVLGVSALLAVALIAGVALASQALLSQNTAVALFLLAPLIAAQALIDLLLAATRWKNRIRYEVAARSVVEPWAALAAAAAAWHLGFDEVGLLIGYGFGTIAALLLAAGGLRCSYAMAELRGWRPAWNRGLTMLRASAANTAADSLSGLLLRLDLYLVGILMGEHAAGAYGMARQLAQPIRQVRQAFDGMLTPMVVRTLKAGGPEAAVRALASATRLILSLQLAMVIGIIALGYPLLRWLGPEFALAWPAAVLLAFAEAVQGAFGVNELLFVYRRPGLGLGIVAAAIGIAFASGLALVALFGITGAAAAVLFSSLSRAWFRREALKRSLGVSGPLRSGFGPTVAAAGGSAVALILLGEASSVAHWGAALAAGLAVYAALLLAWLRLARQTLAMEHFAS